MQPSLRESSREDLKDNTAPHWEVCNEGCVHKTKQQYRLNSAIMKAFTEVATDALENF